MKLYHALLGLIAAGLILTNLFLPPSILMLSLCAGACLITLLSMTVGAEFGFTTCFCLFCWSFNSATYISSLYELLLKEGHIRAFKDYLIFLLS